MFRVSPSEYGEGLGALEAACGGADNIAYRTDLLLADFRPLAEGEFADASAERGAEVGLKAKLLSLSLFALLETMREGKDRLDLVVRARAELDAVAGKGAGGETDPVLDPLVNVPDAATALEGSAKKVATALGDAAGLLAGAGWAGGLADGIARAADRAAYQLSYAQSAGPAYTSYAAAVDGFEAALVPRLDPDGFLQVEAARAWAFGEVAAAGDGIGEWLGAIDAAAGAAGDSLGGIAGVLRGFGTAVEGNEVALARAYAAVRGLGADGARALSRLLDNEATFREFRTELAGAVRRRGGDLAAAMGDIDWVRFGLDEEAGEALARTITNEQGEALDFYRWIDVLGDEATDAGEKIGKYADRLGRVATCIDLLLAYREAGPVGPEKVSHLATEGAVIAGSGALGDAAAGVGGVLGGGAVAAGGLAAVAGGLAWEWYKGSPEGGDFQRDVDALFMGAAGFGSARPNDYCSEAAKRGQIAAAGDGKDE